MDRNTIEIHGDSWKLIEIGGNEGNRGNKGNTMEIHGDLLKFIEIGRDSLK